MNSHKLRIKRQRKVSFSLGYFSPAYPYSRKVRGWPSKAGAITALARSAMDTALYGCRLSPPKSTVSVPSAARVRGTRTRLTVIR
jgi:hypothetical protein